MKADITAFNSTLKRDMELLSFEERVLTMLYFKFVVVGITDQMTVMRYCGAAEIILINFKYLEPLEQFDYIITPKKFWFIKYKEKESYKDFILRLTTKCLSDKGIL
jgi:hypothetical protein